MLAQSDRGRRKAARHHRQSQFRQSGAARDHGPVRRLHPRHRAKPARRSISRSCPATSRSTTRPTAVRSCRRPRSAASGCSTTSPSRRRSLSRRAGETILLVGETTGWLGQSIYLREICGREEGAPPPVDLVEERENGDFVRALILDGIATAAHDLSDGGLAVALAEMAMASGIGAEAGRRARRYPGACLLVRRGPGALSGHRAGGAGRGRAQPGARGASVPVCGNWDNGRRRIDAPRRAPHAGHRLRERFEGWLPAYMAGELSRRLREQDPWRWTPAKLNG